MTRAFLSGASGAALAAALFVCGPAQAQNAVLQVGPWQNGNLPIYNNTGSSTPTVSDSHLSPAALQAALIASCTVATPLLGFDPTGTFSNDSAWQTWATANAGSACLYFPIGNYKLNSAQARTVASGTSTMIVGSGPGSVLLWPNANGGLTFNEADRTASVTLQNIAIETSQASGGSGIIINGAGLLNQSAVNTFNNVTIQGQDGPNGNDAWTTALTLNSVGDVNFQGGSISGLGTYHGSGLTCVSLAGDGVSHYTFQVTFTGTEIAGCQIGFNYGTYVQGLNLNAILIAGVDYGVEVPSSEASLSGLTITGGNIAAYLKAIDMNTSVAPTQVNGVTFEGAHSGANLVSIAKYQFVQFMGNVFLGTGGTDLEIGGGATIGSGSPPASVISGNSFSGGAPGLKIDSDATALDVNHNVFASNNGSPNLNNGVTNALTSLVRIQDNTGFNPTGAQPISVGSSPFTTTPLPYASTYSLVSGTLTGPYYASVVVTLPTQQGGSTTTPQVSCTIPPCTITVGPWQSLYISYSAPPTVYSFGW